MTELEPQLPIPLGWYCIGFGDELADGEIKSVRYFGKDWVLYRTLQGKACLHEAHCSRCGAHFAHGGVVESDGLHCPLDGEVFDAQGQAASPQVASLTLCPVDERNEFIFAWYHPDNEAPLFDLQPFNELDSGDWTACVRREWMINTHIQETGENAVDTAHFAVVHNTGGIETRAEVSFDGPMRKSVIYVGHQRVDEEGAIAEKDTETVEGQIHSVNVGPGQSWSRNYGIDLLMIGLPTPVEVDKLEFRFACSVPKKDEQKNAEITRLILENAYEQVDQDIPIWENKIYRAEPILCDGDGPIAQYRRWFKQFYAEC